MLGSGAQPLVDLAPRSARPVPRSGPDPLAAVGPQSDRVAARVHAGATGGPGRRNGAAQPHQLPLSPAEGVSQRSAPDVGQDERGRAGRHARGLLLRRIRHPRVGSRLLGRPGGAVGRPHQECQRSGRAAGRRRSVLQPGLFQAALGREWLADRGVLGDARSRTCRWSRRWTRRASR